MSTHDAEFQHSVDTSTSMKQGPERIAEFKAKPECTQEQQRKKRKNKGFMSVLVDFESDDEPRSGCTICSLWVGSVE